MTHQHHSDTAGLRALIQKARQQGRTIGFVPTMGFLHRGHQSLIEACSQAGHYTVVSIFVNPAQFGPNEDLDTYPRNPEGDFQLSREAGADLVWYPEVHDLYPPGCQTMVTPGDLAKRLCGLSRPQFFGGICSVVLKFFNIIQPDATWFGEKDFQQLAIIRKMVSDFYLNIQVMGGELIREEDGLAMSSRNARIRPEDREPALTLYRTILNAQEAYRRGERDALKLARELKAAWPDCLELDYLDFREPVLLEPTNELKEDTRIFLGAWLNGVRLIDNARVAP